MERAPRSRTALSGAEEPDDPCRASNRPSQPPRPRPRSAPPPEGCEGIRAYSARLYLVTLRVYSHLSATRGSTFVARRAGIYDASIATTMNASVTRTKVVGSRGVRP